MNGPERLTLAIDASTYEGSVAVVRDGRVLAEGTVAMRGETEERLLPAALAALAHVGAQLREVQQVVCGAGPGSFTSLRIAAAIAKGVAMGNGVRLFAVPSLALIVAGARDINAGDYLAVLDAMRGDRFIAPYRLAANGRVTALGGTERVAADTVAATAERLQATPIGPIAALRHLPHARGVAPMLGDIEHAGPVALDSWEPLYGRLAEAQVKWEAAHGRSLDA